MICTAR